MKHDAAAGSESGKKRHYAVVGGHVLEHLDRKKVIRTASETNKKVLKIEEMEPADVPLCTPPDAANEKLGVLISTEDSASYAIRAAQEALAECKRMAEECKRMAEQGKRMAEQGKRMDEQEKRMVERLLQVEADLATTKTDLATTKTNLAMVEGAAVHGRAVALRFLVDYLFETIKEASKPQQDPRASKPFDAFLEVAASNPPSILRVRHTNSSLGTNAFNISPHVDFVKRHGRLVGKLSNLYCHSSNLKTLAASIEVEVRKALSGEASVLPLDDLKQLQELFASIFGSSTKLVAADHLNGAYLEELVLPSRS